MHYFLTTDGTAAYLLDTLSAILVVPTWRTGVRPLLLQAYATARPCARRLLRSGLVFDVLEKSLRRRPLRKDAEDGPIHIAVPLRNMVGMRCRRLHRWKVSKVTHALKDSVRSLEIGKGRHTGSSEATRYSFFLINYFIALMLYSVI